MARLLTRYREEIRPQMMREFGYANPLAVPSLDRIIVNIGLGEALENDAAVDHAVRDLATITGQRPVVTRARKSVAAFKLRAGQRVGVKGTLRGTRMYEFLDRLVTVALPRMRDFRGVLRTSFDGRGNYSLGLSEQLIFPEIDYDQIDRIRGLQVVIVTTAPSDGESLRLLELLGMPFQRLDEAA
ncbi:MAG: 50S ribosomal protein L5 [Chloroflexota bacterium]|nr:50S ribosomal protein L5 [Chloroflexota bacterium]